MTQQHSDLWRYVECRLHFADNSATFYMESKCLVVLSLSMRTWTWSEETQIK